MNLKRPLLALAALLTLTSISAAPAPQNAKLALNWKPEPQFGGFFAARDTGAFRDAGLSVEIMSGGSGTPTIQMLDAGQVDFAVVSADELVNLRSKGGDVVAIFAVYQTNPQALMTSAKNPATNLKELLEGGGTIAWQAGLPYVSFFKKTYDLSKLKQVPYTGGLPFLSGDDFTQQCFVTSEPLLARKLGHDVKTFLVSESGFNPYTTVVATRGQLLRDKPELVKDATIAIRKGWDAYLADPSKANTVMRRMNPTMDAATYAASAEAQKPLIETEETKANGLGYMTQERWQTLIDQLTAIKAIDKPVKAEECFVPLPPK